MRILDIGLAALAGLAGFAAATSASANDTAGTCPPYESVGTGPDLVLVPGLGSPPTVWDGVKDKLSQDYTVHFVHVGGFAGRSANGSPDTIVERAADEIIAYLDCKGIEGTAYAGHSMGGFLGLKLASEHPGRISQLVIVDSLPFFPLIFSPLATADQVRPQADNIRAQMLSQSDEAFAASQQAGVRSLVSNPDYHQTVADWSIASDRASFAGAMHALMTTDLRPSLSAISTPTTIIAAANSFAPRGRIANLYNGAYSDLPGAQLRIIEDSFHFIMFDQPEAFGEALTAALKSDGSAPAGD
ncbi:MAG: alpha/beta hydrolase [Erythrobacter sp.]